MDTFDSFSLSDSEFNWSSYMQNTTIQLTEIEYPIFKPEVIVTDSATYTTDYVNKNTQDKSLSREENIVANAQLYFNTKQNNEMEVHSLRCIFLDNFVPFNSIFTSSGDDSLDSPERHIFIRSWNLICPCWRLQDPYESGIIRNTFISFENIKKHPPLLSIEENYSPPLPYQEFKKLQKPPLQFQLPVSKTVPITEIYSSRNVTSVDTSFKHPINTTNQLATIFPAFESTFTPRLPKDKNNFCKASIKIPLLDLGISPESENLYSKYNIQKFETAGKEKEKDLQDSVIYLQRIPGTVSDSLYEKDNATMKSKTLAKSMKDLTNASSTEFSNTNLMLVENTLVAVNNCIENEKVVLPVSPVISTSDFGWASNVNINSSVSPDVKGESEDRALNSIFRPQEMGKSFSFSERPKLQESDSLEEAIGGLIKSKEQSEDRALNSIFKPQEMEKSFSVSERPKLLESDSLEEAIGGLITSKEPGEILEVEAAEVVSSEEYDSVEDDKAEEVKSKETESSEDEITDAGLIPENVFENQNTVSIAPVKKDAKKHKLMFSWLKKQPIKQSVILKYLFRGIGFGIASFGAKPKRLGYATEESSMKRKVSFRFKNKFVRNKVIPIDPRSFGKTVVHEKLFKKRTMRRNPKSQKIIQNFEIQNFLPVKILKNNRVVPLPKIADSK